MKKPFLFKRGKYYHLEYFDKGEQRIRRISTGEQKKNDAIKFLLYLEQNQNNKPQIKFISLSDFQKEYEKFIETNLSKAYLIDVNLTFKKLKKNIGELPLRKITTRLVEQFITEEAKKTKVQAKKCFANLRSALIDDIYINISDVYIEETLIPTEKKRKRYSPKFLIIKPQP